MQQVIYPINYDERLRDYNIEKERLAAKREEFYRDNPNFPIKSLFLNVCAPPQKITINTIK